MAICVIKVCRNYKGRLKTTKKVTYHHIPNDPILRSRWIAIIRKSRREELWHPTKTTVICSDHFRAKDLYFVKNQIRRRLKKEAIPSKALFLTSLDTDEDDDENDGLLKDKGIIVGNVSNESAKDAVSLVADSDDGEESLPSPPTSLQVLDTSIESSEDPVIADLVAYNEGKTDATANKHSDAELRILNEQALKITLSRIRANPQLYIGVPLNSYHLINILHEQTQILTTHILLCLKKVKLDTHFEELADQFGMNPNDAKKIFIKNLPIISKALQSFVNSDNEDTQTNLSSPRRRYHSTTVIESLELNVQPVSAKSRALTQTQQGNTVKYIISCNPDGYINYVSPGYGGRQTNETVLENTNYLKRFKPGSSIIANGFKDVEEILKNKGLKLLKPQAKEEASTQNDTEMPQTLNEEEKEQRKMNQEKGPTFTLYNIDRVVQRVREFTMVKDRSVISAELMRVLDDAVAISCALINLQSCVLN